MMETVHTSETSVDYETTRRNILEGYNFHTRRRENLNSQAQFYFSLRIFVKHPHKITDIKICQAVCCRHFLMADSWLQAEFLVRTRYRDQLVGSR
jgi:hypothetical protein